MENAARYTRYSYTTRASMESAARITRTWPGCIRRVNRRAVLSRRAVEPDHAFGKQAQHPDILYRVSVDTAAAAAAEEHVYIGYSTQVAKQEQKMNKPPMSHLNKRYRVIALRQLN